MKNDRPKENEKGKYKRFSQFPSRNYTQRKSYLLFTRLYVVLAYILLSGLSRLLIGPPNADRPQSFLRYYLFYGIYSAPYRITFFTRMNSTKEIYSKKISTSSFSNLNIQKIQFLTISKYSRLLDNKKYKN